jgi:glycosyltransferase involved in cell wall biosynthesis
MAMLVSVIICTYNREKYILNALESLVKQDADKSLFEVIIANNNSKDNTENLCRDFIRQHGDYSFTYVNESQQGASFARNTGARIAKGELFCFMDDDAVARPDFISSIIRFHKQQPDAGGYGGRIIPLYIPSEPRWMSYYVSSLVGNFDYAKEVTEFKPNRYPLESNMVVTRQLFEEVNGFNADIPGVKGTLRIGGEGKDLFLRAKAKGYRIFYVPYIVVQHVVETDKLTPDYMYRVASGIGRGERERIKKTGEKGFYKKLLEYYFKLGASVVIAIFYCLKLKPAKAWPVIQFRIDVLKGFLEKTSL